MWTRKLNIENLALAGKRVIIRADFNVPLHNGKIANNKKLIAGLDSIVYALVKEAQSVMIISHIGWPKGTRNMRYSLNQVTEDLDSLMKQVHRNPKSLEKYSQVFKLYSASHKLPHVQFLSDCTGPEIEEVSLNCPSGSIFLLENLRFHLEEEGHGEDTSGNKIYAPMEAIRAFRQSLSRLGDVYINDAFSLSHRTDSSMLGQGFETRAAGLLVKKEILYFKKAMYRADRPFLAILGGMKIIDKLHMIDNLLDKVSEMIIAGAMAFPFLKKLKRMNVGHSFFDVEGSQVVKMIIKKAKQNRVNIHFPVDFMSCSKLGAIQIETIRTGIEEGWMGLDIGPETCSIFKTIILRAKMIVWNGPPGAYELDNFRTGTESVLFDVVKATSRGATSILLGEDTAASAAQWNQEGLVSHISTGGVAAKHLLQGKILPGVAALSDNNQTLL
uniref:Phosphoglycerate kinase n=1 Tax=Graphocephala atropunctata TaxID=36148 RepID=A0A1B6KMX8_9HEMI